MRNISIIFLLACSCIMTATAQQGKGKDRGQLENTATLNGRNEASKASAPGQIQKTGTATAQDAAMEKGQKNGSAAPDAVSSPDAMPDAVGAEASLDIPAPSTEGMSPARAAKTKYMHENERLKARNANAESKLAQAKAKIAKSKASLESKKKKGKISAAEYEAGMAKIKAAEEKMQYLDTMVGETKQKTF